VSRHCDTDSDNTFSQTTIFLVGVYTLPKCPTNTTPVMLVYYEGAKLGFEDFVIACTPFLVKLHTQVLLGFSRPQT
jgi:hypothetical protein